MSDTTTTWLPCGDITDDEAIADAIIRWHDRDTDLRGYAPRDAEFANACWETPAGSHHPERLRVTMPCGNVYILSIEREGGGGDDGRGECRYYHVVDGRTAQDEAPEFDKYASEDRQ